MNKVKSLKQQAFVITSATTDGKVYGFYKFTESDLDTLLKEEARKAFNEGFNLVPCYWGRKRLFEDYWKQLTSG